MKTFPMFLKVAGRRVMVLGGGEQAAQKSRLILKSEAEVVLCAPHLDDELVELVREGRVQHHDGAITPDLIDGAALAFVATGCPGMDAALADLVRVARVPANVVDQPELCDAFTPSIVDRDPLVVAIGTEGTAPVLGRQVKTAIEQMLEPRLGHLASLAGRMRPAVARGVDRARRRAFWRWVFDGPPRQLHAIGNEREAAQALKEAIAQGQAPDDTGLGSIAVIAASGGIADLMTLRAVRKLQECDVIFHDAGMDAVLELARRDAERVCVGPRPGAIAWPEARIADVILSEAHQGHHVVWLTGGATANALAEAAQGQGLSVEKVPGVSGGHDAPARSQPA
ncbi:NAD(P)-dependent oxidoreductase [Fluviibacterium sp. S390]|uniref:precorrin-2 dehydrogenase/sirohydrochlorin ferrochelatase family protein n=1 Tax=Fluviibacterium sp. S390 TaxID=3415139 RepID=UPI003C7B7AD4